MLFSLKLMAKYHKAQGEVLIKCAQMVVLDSAKPVKTRELPDGHLVKHETKRSANVLDLIPQKEYLML